MDRRLVGVSAAATVILAVAAWWFWPGAPPEPAVSPEPVVPTKTPGWSRVPAVAARRAEAVPPAVLAVAPPSPREQGIRVLAEYAGEGVLRCPVGDLVPEGRALGLSHAVVEAGMLIGTVVEPEGDARVQAPGDAPSDPPRAVVRWTGAWPAEEGRCEVLLPELVPVHGWVVDGAGAAVVAGQVGNAVDGAWPVDPDGGFVVECWRGARCPLAARVAVGAPWGPFVGVVPDGPAWDVEVVLEATPQQDLVSYLQEQVAEHERLAAMPDPLALAVRDPRVPEEARELLRAWQDEDAAERRAPGALLAELSPP